MFSSWRKGTVCSGRGGTGFVEGNILTVDYDFTRHRDLTPQSTGYSWG